VTWGNLPHGCGNGVAELHPLKTPGGESARAPDSPWEGEGRESPNSPRRDSFLLSTA
jgi:hypothetical protein